MKYLITILLIATFFSCQSGRAREYNSLLDSTDRKVFRILVADSLESNRLKALVARKPDVAFSIGKKQANRLKSIIQEVDHKNVMGIDDADRLKKSTINYYKTILSLKELDILEAQLMTITLQKDTAKAKKAAMDISDLPRKRLTIHKAISDSDQARQKAKSTFLQVNHIR